MAYEIVLGRDSKSLEQFGIDGAVFLARHYVKMGQVSSLSNNIFLDVNNSHVVFIAGKRGSGKSYTLSAIAEGILDLPAEQRSSLSVVMLDTMGVFWTMKYPNRRDSSLLKDWGFEPKGVDIKIYSPSGYFDKLKAQGIPVDAPFSLRPDELSAEDWFLTFDIEPFSPLGVFIERVILNLKEKNKSYDIVDILESIDNDSQEEPYVRLAAKNRFLSANEWKVFEKEGTPLHELVKGGQITVLDLSPYAIIPNGWRIKFLVIGLVSKNLFVERLIARRKEEQKSIEGSIDIFARNDIDDKTIKHMPLVWLLLDEAHEFLPLTGKTAATDALVTILREGRQPGISLALATQQPGKIHTDVMTQSDIIIAHRLTARVDTEALGALMQSYMRSGLDKELNNLPRISGAAIMLDDVNERMYPAQIRPKVSWHGGSAPKILKEKRDFLGNIASL